MVPAFVVQPVQIGVVALLVPPGSFELLGTTTWLQVIVSVLGTELHAFVLSQ